MSLEAYQSFMALIGVLLLSADWGSRFLIQTSILKELISVLHSLTVFIKKPGQRRPAARS